MKEKLIDLAVFTIFVEVLILFPTLAVVFGLVLVYNFISDMILDKEW